MRAGLLLAVLLPLAGCEAARIYFHETAGITPGQLLPIAQQERQYVDDRNLEAKVRSAVGPGVEVDVYLKEVTLKGASPVQLEAVRKIPGVKKVESR